MTAFCECGRFLCAFNLTFSLSLSLFFLSLLFSCLCSEVGWTAPLHHRWKLSPQSPLMYYPQYPHPHFVVLHMHVLFICSLFPVCAMKLNGISTSLLSCESLSLCVHHCSAVNLSLFVFIIDQLWISLSLCVCLSHTIMYSLSLSLHTHTDTHTLSPPPSLSLRNKNTWGKKSAVVKNVILQTVTGPELWNGSLCTLITENTVTVLHASYTWLVSCYLLHWLFVQRKINSKHCLKTTV